MVKKRGRMIYVPRDVIEEVGNIQSELDISRPDAFRKMVKFCRNGRFNLPREAEKHKKNIRGLW